MKTLLIALILLSTSCYDNDEVVSGQIHSYNSSSEELELLNLINQYRASQNKPQLQLINHISYKSQEHNIYMIDNNVIGHYNFEQRANNLIQVLGAVSVAENIAYNYSTPQAVLHVWLNSHNHKAVLDGDYTHFGASITINESGNKYYTNIFIR